MRKLWKFFSHTQPLSFSSRTFLLRKGGKNFIEFLKMNFKRFLLRFLSSIIEIFATKAQKLINYFTSQTFKMKSQSYIKIPHKI